MIFSDLTADHDRELDRQTISGTGLSGQVTRRAVHARHRLRGLRQACTSRVLSQAIANAVQTVHTRRFAAPDVIVMHPRRWGWLLTLLDTNNGHCSARPTRPRSTLRVC